MEKFCDVCGAPAKLVHNIEIYGHPVGQWPWHWLCTDRVCGSHCETVFGTDQPRQKMATPATKAARKEAHKVFDRLWSSPQQRRNAYKWLRREMDLSAIECHISNFDEAQCEEVIRLVQDLNPSIPEGEEATCIKL